MWSRHSRRIEPISLSAWPFCQGERLRCRVIPDAHRRHPSPDKLAVASIAVADEMSRRLVPREGLGDLLRNPLRRRMIGHAQRDQTSPLMPQNHQHRQQPEIDRRHDEEVHGADTGRVIAQERLPRLARPSGPALGHILGDGRLSDLDPELQQLTVNAGRAPQRVLHAHPPDQAANLDRDLGSAAARPRLPSPIEPEARAVPA